MYLIYIYQFHVKVRLPGVCFKISHPLKLVKQLAGYEMVGMLIN